MNQGMFFEVNLQIGFSFFSALNVIQYAIKIMFKIIIIDSFKVVGSMYKIMKQETNDSQVDTNDITL